MTLEKAIKILELNVPFSRSPEASQIKETIEIVKFALGQKKIEIHLEESFLKECECEIENAKEQAVREFAERLKARFAKLEYKTDTHRKTCSINQLDATVNWVISEVTSVEIDNLVNEMFGNPE